MFNMSFFRYPGGKSKLKEQIIKKLGASFASDPGYEYREPFFGGGSIGLGLLNKESIKNIWINDKDDGIACLWTSVIAFPNLLKDFVRNFEPAVKLFDKYKEELLQKPPMLKSDKEIAEYGFKKLAIHQISYSGLGTKSGGPLGGRKQKYNKIDCRWSPNYICTKIDKLHEQFEQLNIRKKSCTCLDFEDVIKDNTCRAVIYLDPPYYVKGNDLYQCGFDEADHRRLSVCLKTSSHHWVLSYDDCEEVRDLYTGWAHIDEITVNYSITGLKEKNESTGLATGKTLSRKKSELLISKL